MSNKNFNIPYPDTSGLEWQVLHDAITDDSVIPEILNIVKSSFFEKERQPIWDTVRDLYNRGKRVDTTTIGSMFPDAIQFIFSSLLSDSGVLAARQHAFLLRDAAARKRMYLAAMQMLSASQQNDLAEEDVYATAAAAGDTIREEFTLLESSLGDVVNDIADAAQQRAKDIAEGRLVKVPTGFAYLDSATYGGFGPGELVVLAARPSQGKTALALQLSKTAAAAGKKVVFFSLEMLKEELGSRLLFSTDLVSPKALAKGEPDWPAFEEAAGQLDLPFLINDKTRSLRGIISRMTLLHNAGLCDVAVVDYLSLVNSGLDPRTPYRQILGAIAKAFKEAAKDLGIPVVLLAQLNRDSAKDGRAPEMYDLAESAEVEHHSDKILMIQATDVLPGETLPRLRLWVRKNRNGRKDFAVELKLNETYSSFEEIGIYDERQ